MTRALRTRGPDDEGIVLISSAEGRARNLATDATAAGVGVREIADSGTEWPHRLAMGHTRFSIVDLSPAGHQPFWSSDGTICITFNGEIYNYVELRNELRRLGRSFRTESDTEVLAEAFLEWGPDAFSKFSGFWAVALYDARRQKLLFARDRIGKAPLYIARWRNRLWWSSEIESLIEGAGSDVADVREDAIVDFVVHNWRDVANRTFYERIDTFPAASFAWVESDGQYSTSRYWSLPSKRAQADELSVAEAAADLRERLAEAVRIRMRADVPVGFELSGGMDSSALVAIAASTGHRLQSFTMRYPGADSDELPYARQVWQRYADRVDFHVSDYSTSDFFKHADYAVARMAEPFHSPVLLSNQTIWQDMRAQGIRVSIHGAGGDEAFAGYAGIYHLPYLWSLIADRRFGRFHREVTSFSEAPTNAFSRAYFATALRALNVGLHGAGMERFAFAERRARRRSHEAGLRLSASPSHRRRAGIELLLHEEMTDWRMNYWMRSANQSFMSLPIEVRFPFLDHRVVELAFSLPLEYLIRDGWMKWILREATREILPQSITMRPTKVGFPFPLSEWLIESKAQFFNLMRGVEIPAVDLTRLETAYDTLARTDAPVVWRMMSVALWWKKCVLGEPLQPARVPQEPQRRLVSSPSSWQDKQRLTG